MNELNEKLVVLGLVLELNPPHKGHKYFIDKAKELIKPDVIIGIYSTNFSMRGDVMALDKFTKTSLTLELGLDIIMELPFLSSVCSSEYFCFNAITSLVKMGITDLCFGIEDCTLDNLYELKKATESPLYKDFLKENLSKGYSYSTSCNKSLASIICKDELINYYSLPNNVLGIQYLKALDKLKAKVKVTTVKRIVNKYYQTEITADICSSTSIRKCLLENKNIKDFVIFPNINYHNLNISYDNIYKLLLYKFSIHNSVYFSNILNVNEGIESRISKAILKSNNYFELLSYCISKRHRENHIKRIFLNILLDINKENLNLTDNYISYLRILGLSTKGESYLKTLNPKIKKEILTTFKNIENNNIANVELKATKLFGIITNNNNLYLNEYKMPIKK